MKAALSIALALLLAGCSEVVAPGWDLRVETSQAVYVLPGGPAESYVTVQFTVRNAGARMAVLPHCGESVDPRLQRREAGAWVDVPTLVCLPGGPQASPVLPPGRTASGLTVVGEPGEYRLLIPVAENVDATYTSYAVSPSFIARSVQN